jgi:hypothetical protein
MPWSEQYPFHRLGVAHMIRGVSRIWWELLPTFQDPRPHSFQLQVGFAGTPGATDWQNVGLPAVDSFFAEDDTTQRLYGKRLLTHYRVILTTPLNQFVSPAQEVYGYLNAKDWPTAREIVRKERLRLGLVASEGLLLKRMRYGPPCTCIDPTTRESTNSNHLPCHGTGIQVGYFPPVPFSIDAEPDTIDERKNGATPPGQSQKTDFWARVAGFPQVAFEDVWANRFSGERWYAGEVQNSGQVRGIPIVVRAHFYLLPYTHPAYQLQIGGEPTDNPDLPTAGTGCVTVTNDYGGQDALSYTTGTGCGIEGATIQAFTKANYDAGNRAPSFVIASTNTTANGRWTYALQLNPGDYVLVFQKIGAYGPDAVPLHVTNPDASLSSSSSSQPYTPSRSSRSSGSVRSSSSRFGI